MYRESSAEHRTVLLEETVNMLRLAPDAVAVDATLGGGGHARAMSARLGHRGRLVMLDADPETLHRTRLRMEEEASDDGPTLSFVHANFRDLARVLHDLALREVDAVLADLGWNSEQFETSNRGFSFKPAHADEPLAMTYGDPDKALFTARDIVMQWSEADIANVLFGYGEERYARRIAKAIVERREREPIETAGVLASTIERAVPAGYRRGKIHPATKSFQGLRIAVNDELGALQSFIDAAWAHLAPQGRLAIITFHSIEDRIVKQRFRELAREGEGALVTKKPIIASPEELTRNPRARSAKLRVLEKTS